PLRGVRGPLQRRVVSVPRLVRSPQPSQQLRANRVIEVVVLERELLHHSQRRLRSLHLGQRDRAVERDDRRRRDGQQLVVQRENLRPVGQLEQRRGGVHGVDGRLQ